MVSRFKDGRIRTYQRRLGLILAIGPLLGAAGCFSLDLGERTPCVQDSPEILQRIATLETRLQTLEQTFQPPMETLYPQTDVPERLPAPIYPSTLPAEH